jgi:DNA-binding FadR family transcriptional regulator
VKKNNPQEQTRRLSLNRETLRLLTDPGLLEFAKGGGTTVSVTQTVESTSQSGSRTC